MRIWGLLAATAVLATAGCATGGAKDDDPPSGTNAAKESPSAKAAKKADDGPLKFGQAFTWKKGITVTVRKPAPYKPSETAAVGKGPHHVAIGIKLVNKTGKPFDPNLIYTTVQSGNKEAEADFDSERGIGNTPQTAVLDGREVTFKLGFAVQNVKDLVLQLSPDAGIEYKAALWQT